MISEEQRKKDVNKFFKETFNVDLEILSSEKSKVIIEEINKRLLEQLEVEKKKNEYLTQELYYNRQKINDLIQELGE